MRIVTPATEKIIGWYLLSFEAFERGLNGRSKMPVHLLRRAAIARFVEMGFPTTKDEEWRFTNIAPIVKTEFRPAVQPSDQEVSLKDIGKFMFGGMACHRLVFLNGHFAPGLSSMA